MKKFVKQVVLFFIVTWILAGSSVLVRAAVWDENQSKALLAGATPATGEAKLLGFNVEFPEQEKVLMTEELQERMFGEGESITSFYLQSSYGKLHFTGQAYTYTTQKAASEYTSQHEIFDELFAYYSSGEEAIDWSAYDADTDGYLDGVYFIFTQPSDVTPMGGYVTGYVRTIGDRKIEKAVYLCDRDKSSYIDAQTLIHETCHMIGPPDIYARVSLNAGGTHTESILDGGRGDLPAIIKYVLGWIEEPIIVTDKARTTYELEPVTTDSQIMIIYPNGDSTSKFWFVVEYVTPSGNSESFDKQGLRIWRALMNYDENGKIVGIDEATQGMMPSPYTFLDSVHPVGERDYYFTEGDIFVPDSSYGSFYGTEIFVDENGNAYLEDLQYSGVSIDNISISGEKAVFDVEIREKPEVVGEDFTLTAKLNDTDVSYVLDDSRYYIADISCDSRISGMKEETGISLESEDVSIPLTCELAQNKNVVQIFIDKESIRNLDIDGKYQIKIPEGVFSTCRNSYNNAVAVDFKVPVIGKVMEVNESGTVSNPYAYEIPYSILDKNIGKVKYIRRNIAYASESGAEHIFSMFTVGEEESSEIYLENPCDGLVNMTSELDGTTEIPIYSISEDYFMTVVQYDGKVYLDCYDASGRHIDGIELENVVFYTAMDKGEKLLFGYSGVLYQVECDGSNLIMAELTFMKEYASLSTIVATKNGYVVYNYKNTMISLDREGNIRATRETGNMSYTQVHGNGTYIDVYTVNADKVHLCRYDEALNVLIDRDIVTNIPAVSTNIANLAYVGEKLYISLTYVPNTYGISYGNTLLLGFDEKLAITDYYRYGTEQPYCYSKITAISEDEAVLLYCYDYQNVAVASAEDYELQVVTSPILSGTYGQKASEMLLVDNAKVVLKDTEIVIAGKWSVALEDAEYCPNVNDTRKISVVFTPNNTNMYAPITIELLPVVVESPDEGDNGNEDSGNSGSGSEDNGNEGSGSEDSGSEDSGSGGSGSEDSGSEGSGSEDSGSGGSGSEDNGNGGNGSEDSGSEGSGSEDSGSGGSGSENNGSGGSGSEDSGNGVVGSENAGGTIEQEKVHKIPAKKIKLNVKTLYIVKGKKVNLKATMTPLNSTDQVTWSSSKRSIATVNKGKISAKKTGKTIITAKTTSGKKITCKVYVVKKAKKAKAINLNKKKIKLNTGARYDLIPKLKPFNSTDTIKWKSSNKKIATVDAFGTVTAIKRGTVKITAMTSSGKKCICKVTVK